MISLPFPFSELGCFSFDFPWHCFLFSELREVEADSDICPFWKSFCLVPNREHKKPKFRAIPLFPFVGGEKIRNLIYQDGDEHVEAGL